MGRSNNEALTYKAALAVIGRTFFAMVDDETVRPLSHGSARHPGKSSAVFVLCQQIS
jgi:hypothetical protein